LNNNLNTIEEKFVMNKSKNKFYSLEEIERLHKPFTISKFDSKLGVTLIEDFIDYLSSNYKDVSNKRNYAMKKVPIIVDNDKDKGEFRKEYQFQSSSLWYYDSEHVFTTREYTEMLWSLAPIFWFIVRNSHLIINDDILDFDYINDVDPLPDLEDSKWERSHVLALKELVKHAGFNNTEEAEDAKRWITVQEIREIIGYDWGTTSSNLRDFRKPPSGRFSILRRKREKEFKTSDSNEYAIIVDTLGRDEI